jgi:CheY-like chemotaxis protein
VSSAMRGPNGRVEYFVAVLEDVTDKLRLQASESALARAESVSLAKSEFVSRMSHELRTPLNAMLGFAQLLGLDRKPNIAPHQHEWVQQIQRAGWHLLALINETLDLARIESGAVQLKLEPVQLGPLITACQALVQTAADKRRLELRVRLDDKAHAVLADTTRLKQVLTNLLSNAVKYNRDRGSVQITTRLLPGKHGTAMVDISVTDTGLGMTPEQLANLFQPYNRLGRENSEIDGTGIGLVISRRLAELMGGALEASGEPGRGATFSLRLPMHSDSASVPELNSDPTTHALPPLYQQRRVHYVEDNLTNVEVMRGVLLQRSQIVLETSTLGLDGLLSIRHQRPDLILLDMQLPDISGLELLRHLKQDDAVADVPVIVVSADATPQRMEQALTLGALHYVTKPLDIAHFLSLVDDALMASQTRL